MCPRINEAADRAVKEVLETEPVDNVIPFSDLKPLTAKYIHQVWQKEWDEATRVSNKLHNILPKLSDKLLTSCNTRNITQFFIDNMLVIPVLRIPFF